MNSTSPKTRATSSHWPIRTYRVSGDSPVERVAEAFGAAITCSDPDESFDTIGGSLPTKWAMCPKRGEQVVLWGLISSCCIPRVGPCAGSR